MGLKRAALAASVTLLLDQSSKSWVAALLPFGEAYPLTPFLQIVAVRNPGAAFSLLADAGGWQRWLFLLLALLISLWLLREARRVSPSTAVAHGLIVGGALGNAWDRLMDGAVFDFILIHIGKWAWPAFNLADTAITLGVGWLFLDLFRPTSSPSPPPNSPLPLSSDRESRR
ncbi:MAG: signal peptidase II [Hydrogenophilus sp.]|nr:signal peptidase II [Hydrogenophilus sp.]